MGLDPPFCEVCEIMNKGEKGDLLQLVVPGVNALYLGNSHERWDGRVERHHLSCKVIKFSIVSFILILVVSSSF